MLRGCSLTLVLYATLAVGYFYWLRSVFPPPGVYIGAAVVGFLVLCCLGALSNARRALKDWSLASFARHGLPPRDGELIAVTGTIHPIGEPLIAPFSGEQCVVCEYNLASNARVASAEDQQSTGSDYAGFLMSPCVIRSPMGDIRLLGFPILDGCGETSCDGYSAALNARAFLTSTPFEDRAGLKFVGVLSVFNEVWSDDDGLVQKNLKLSKADPLEIFPPTLDEALARPEKWEAERPEQLAYEADATAEADDDGDEDDRDEDGDDFENEQDEEVLTIGIPKMTEKRVGVGEQVCVIGVYHEMNRGLLPPAGSGKPNRLIRGSADQVEQKSRSAFFRNLVGSLVALVVIHAGVYGVMQAYWHSLQNR
jgi:hypothetical protein